MFSKINFFNRNITVEKLISIIDNYCENKIIDSEAANFIVRILSVSSTQVRDIQTPKSKMIYFTLNSKMTEIIEKVKVTRHSRFIVLDEEERKPVGVLISKDLLIAIMPTLTSHTKLDEIELSHFKELLHPCKVTPDSKRIDHLLREFRQDHVHIAAVIDEYGAIDGLVSLEDIIEEIIGEIEDEKDQVDEQAIEEVGPSTYIVDASCDIDLINQQLQVHILDEHFDTIGGYVCSHFEHIPQPGDEVVIERLTFKIKNADKKKVSKIEISIKSNPAN